MLKFLLDAVRLAALAVFGAFFAASLLAGGCVVLIFLLRWTVEFLRTLGI